MKLFYKILPFMLVVPLFACENTNEVKKADPSLKVELTTIPENFPINDVPLIEGDIISAIEADPQIVKEKEITDSWMITINSKVPNIKKVIRDSYEKHGFEVINNFDIKENNKIIGIFFNSKFQVNITLTDTADIGRYLVYYSISKNIY